MEMSSIDDSAETIDCSFPGPNVAFDPNESECSVSRKHGKGNIHDNNIDPKMSDTILETTYGLLI